MNDALSLLRQAEEWLRHSSTPTKLNTAVAACWAIWAGVDLVMREQEGTVSCVLQDGKIVMLRRSGGVDSPISDEALPGWIKAWLAGGEWIGAVDGVCLALSAGGPVLLETRYPGRDLEAALLGAPGRAPGLTGLLTHSAQIGIASWSRMAAVVGGDLGLDGQILAALLAPHTVDDMPPTWQPSGRTWYSDEARRSSTHRAQMIWAAAKACTWRQP